PAGNVGRGVPYRNARASGRGRARDRRDHAAARTDRRRAPLHDVHSNLARHPPTGSRAECSLNAKTAKRELRRVRDMTGYTVHTGPTINFAQGGDKICANPEKRAGGGEKKPPAVKRAKSGRSKRSR